VALKSATATINAYAAPRAARVAGSLLPARARWLLERPARLVASGPRPGQYARWGLAVSGTQSDRIASTRQLNRAVHAAAKAARESTSAFSMHTLRHCFATHLLEPKGIRVIRSCSAQDLARPPRLILTWTQRSARIVSPRRPCHPLRSPVVQASCSCRSRRSSASPGRRGRRARPAHLSLGQLRCVGHRALRGSACGSLDMSALRKPS